MAEDNAAKLLLSYVKLIAERHSSSHNQAFESELFEAVGDEEPSHLLTPEDRGNLRYLVGRTNVWVTYDLETNDFRLINVYDWIKLHARE